MPSYPKVSSTTALNKAEIAKGQDVRVTVTVEGDEIIQQESIETAIVFVLDCSGSMAEGGKIGALKRATSALLSALDPNRDQVAIVAFGDGASLVFPMGNDIALAKSKVAALGAGGSTNMLAGLRIGIREIESAPSHFSRMVLLISDGAPNYGTASQITSLVESTLDRFLVIHSVGIGQADETLLKYISTITGGKYVPSPTTTALDQLIKDIYLIQSKLLSTRAIQIHEQVGSQYLQFVPNSLTASVTLAGLDAASYEQDLAAKEPEFALTGELDLPTIGYLGKRLTVSYSYSLRAIKSDPQMDLNVNVHGPRSKIAYRNGDINVTPEAIDPKSVKILKGAAYLSKKWKEHARLMEISLYNASGIVIRDIEVRDTLASDFYYDETGRPDEFVPLANIDAANPDRAVWILDKLEDERLFTIQYPVKEGAATPSGSIPIERDDAWSTWLWQIELLSILNNEAGFLLLQSDLTSSATFSVATLGFLSSKIAAGSTSPLHVTSASISIATPAMQGSGYEWEVGFSPAELRAALQVPQTSGIQGSEIFTGKAFVRKGSDRYTFDFEVGHQEQLPKLYTTPDFMPKP